MGPPNASPWSFGKAVRLLDLNRTFCIAGVRMASSPSDLFEMLAEAEVGSGDTPVSVTPSRVKCGRSSA